MGLGEIEAAQILAGQLGVDEIRRQGLVGFTPLVPGPGTNLIEMVGVGHSGFSTGCVREVHYTADR